MSRARRSLTSTCARLECEIITHMSSFQNSIPQENGSPLEHAQYVWKHIVKNAKAKKINIVAHSFGGVVTVDLVSLSLSLWTNFVLFFSIETYKYLLVIQMAAKFDEFKNRVHKIAFTDSVHILHTQGVSQKMQRWIIKVGCLYNTSPSIIPFSVCNDREQSTGCQVTSHWTKKWTPILVMLRESLLVSMYSTHCI